MPFPETDEQPLDSWDEILNCVCKYCMRENEVRCDVAEYETLVWRNFTCPSCGADNLWFRPIEDAVADARDSSDDTDEEYEPDRSDW